MLGFLGIGRGRFINIFDIDGYYIREIWLKYSRNMAYVRNILGRILMDTGYLWILGEIEIWWKYSLTAEIFVD